MALAGAGHPAEAGAGGGEGGLEEKRKRPDRGELICRVGEFGFGLRHFEQGSQLCESCVAPDLFARFEIGERYSHSGRKVLARRSKQVGLLLYGKQRVDLARFDDFDHLGQITVGIGTGCRSAMHATDKTRETPKAKGIAGDQFDPMAGKPQCRDRLARRQAGAFAEKDVRLFRCHFRRYLGVYLSWLRHSDQAGRSAAPGLSVSRTCHSVTGEFARPFHSHSQRTAMNRVLAHTGARYPIVQAPMGWIARTQLASAVSRAGGDGILETSSGETAACQDEINKMKALNLPFGVNLPIRFLRDEAMLKFVCNSGVKFVTTSAGSPAKFIAPLKAAGIIVYHAVPTVETALKCVEAGVDGLVVEGAEGGGFKNPEEVSTLVLLQGVRARTDVPMIAAGGICDGRGMAAAFALGAEGIQMGTRFVSCSESPVHANYKNAIVEAKETGTLVLNKKSTPCIRALKSERTRAIHDSGLMAPDALKGIRDVYFHGDMEAAPALAGQSAGLIDKVKSAREIIEETVAQFFAITGRLGGLASAGRFG